jgi:hypothetical protein
MIPAEAILRILPSGESRFGQQKNGETEKPDNRVESKFLKQKDMKKMIGKKGKSAFGGAVRRLRMACLLVLGVWCMAGCDKDDDLLGKTGTITYGGSTYTVRVGDIGKDAQGYTYVELLGVPALLGIRNGNASPVISAKITAGGATFEANSFYMSPESITYYFSTKKDPEKITVYSSDGSTLVF